MGAGSDTREWRKQRSAGTARAGGDCFNRRSEWTLRDFVDDSQSQSLAQARSACAGGGYFFVGRNEPLVFGE